MLRVCQQLASIVQNVEQSLLLLVTQATDLSLCIIKCCSVVFGITLRRLVINVSSSSTAINKLSRLLPAISVTICGTMALHLQRRVDNSWLVAASRAVIGSESRFLPLPHLHSMPPLGGFLLKYCHAVWYGKTRMAWLPEDEIFLKICLFVLTESMNVMDSADNFRKKLKTHLFRNALGHLAHQRRCVMRYINLRLTYLLTHRHTHRHRIGHACIALCGKK